MISTDNAFIEKLNQLIDDNLDNPLFSIDTICQALGVSRSQLHRLLKSHSSLSASLYIRHRRLLKAKDLLLSTDLRISEISDRVGMGNPQNFSTYFAEEFAASPSEFRKLHRSLSTVDAAAVDAAVLATSLPVAQTVSLPHPLTPRRSRWWLGALGLVLAFVGLFSWIQSNVSERPTTATSATVSLAVLPFANLGLANTNPACEGITDEVHTSVSHLKNLRVTARTSSDQFKNTHKSIWQIGEELRVDNVLKGSVLQTGNQLQIKAELIRTKDDSPLWSHTYRGAYTDLFVLTEQIVRDVADMLDQKLTPVETVKLDRLPTRNLAAYAEYIKGKHLMLARTAEKLRASVSKFNHAVALDTTFADAYAARASAYLIMGDFGVLDKKESLQQAEFNALEAIRLDATNGPAYAALADLYRVQNKWNQALLTFQIALKHSPNDAQTNFWYGIALRSIGRFEEAIRYETRAVALNPLYPAALIGLISTCANAGRHDLALKAIRDGEALFNDNYMYHYARSFYHLTLGENAKAVAAMRVSDSLSRSTKPLTYYRLYLRGRTLPRQQFLAELQTIAPTPDSYLDLTCAYAGVENREQCLRYLQLAVDHDSAPDYLKVTPMFAFLHRDPRFTRILRQCNLTAPK